MPPLLSLNNTDFQLFHKLIDGAQMKIQHLLDLPFEPWIVTSAESRNKPPTPP
jgi:hypothetical protein